MTQYRKTENTMSLLAGAALGAAAMYLFDPEAGRRRRGQIGEMAGGAVHGAGEAVGPLWERVSDTARSLTEKAGGYGSALAAGAATFAERARERARDAGSGISDQAGEYTAGARHGVSDWWHRGRRRAGHWIGGESDHGHGGQIAGFTAAGLGTLALGAAAMYLFDPQRGRGRRSVLANKVTSFVNQTGTTFCRMGRDLSNRAYGVAAETRGAVQDRLGYGEEASAEKLLHRVRSELGRASSNPSAVQVMTDNNGRVTLTGCVLAGESDAVVAAVRGVRGVSEVVNLLDVENDAGAMSRASVSATAAGQRRGSQSVPPM